MATPDDLHVERVLRARYWPLLSSTPFGELSHFDVLELPAPLDAAAPLVPKQTVRSRYKALAVRVHPDKNRAPDAEEAFKRISVAYDCLSIESSQREHITQLLRARSCTSSTRSSTHPRYKAAPPSRHHKRKRKQQSDEATPNQEPRRYQTPEEIWQQFQREEEELARREFIDKGFERVYDDEHRKKRRESSVSPLSASPNVQEEVINSDLDAKATRWATWSTNSSKTCQSEGHSVKAALDHDLLSNSAQTAPLPPLICCLLCRRKFSTRDQLQRHEKHSALHASNLTKAAKTD